ncbi:OapA family protein [Endozoicomonas sp. 8E]|uniref:OapA family protein n=1 Tax=Endozoicomonas sp. 8E TaxID=3035692 RepID=UPI0029390DC6|nr:peptidoglycan DD-metalloendopeptidase family protein [Endozoicomonas sp. 8E]WOG26726.1 peptidoglycan DD-metalloendopeptidase family protein [Endozoicomonas sp. 8E]
MTRLSPRGATRKRPGGIKSFPKRHLLLVTGVAATVMTVIGLLPSPQVEAKRSETELLIDEFQPSSPKEALKELALEEEDAPEQTVPEETKAQREAREKAERLAAEEAALGPRKSITIESGDNLSILFDDMGLSARTVYEVSRTPKLGKNLNDILPGQTFEYRVNSKGVLTQLRYVQNKLESILYERQGNGYVGKKITLQPELRIAFAEASIKNSLFLASQNAGLSEKMTMELAGIFGWDIDFALDIRSGDSFNVMYEEKYLGNEKLGDGNILAATFINQGEAFTAVRYTNSHGDSNYYSPDGKSMKKAFLRTPVNFTRISSSFNPNRLHPIFKTKRPHNGTDYAAPTGTPIKAAGDGKIQFIGWQNGFGNVVFIQHPHNIVTVYAHQSRVNKRFKKGSQVKQGQTIGYVGQTGWATGPHLHYEFRVNGVHRNPVTVKLPNASPIPKAEKARFMAFANKTMAQLEKHGATMLARNEKESK